MMASRAGADLGISERGAADKILRQKIFAGSPVAEIPRFVPASDSKTPYRTRVRRWFTGPSGTHGGFRANERMPLAEMPCLEIRLSSFPIRARIYTGSVTNPGIGAGRADFITM
jgi:hypothetical protein